MSTSVRPRSVNPRSSTSRVIAAPWPQYRGKSTNAKSAPFGSHWKPPHPAKSPSTNTAHGP